MIDDYRYPYKYPRISYQKRLYSVMNSSRFIIHIWLILSNMVISIKNSLNYLT
jgi:hypothetical protein